MALNAPPVPGVTSGSVKVEQLGCEFRLVGKVQRKYANEYEAKEGKEARTSYSVAVQTMGGQFFVGLSKDQYVNLGEGVFVEMLGDVVGGAKGCRLSARVVNRL